VASTSRLPGARPGQALATRLLGEASSPRPAAADQAGHSRRPTPETPE